MSGGDDFEDFGDLDLDLDDALDAWEQEIEKDGVVQAKAAPMPQHSDTPPKPAPGRPLYRPDPELMGRRSTPAPEPEPRRYSPDDFSDDFEDEQESTRIAQVPADLMKELQALRASVPDAEPVADRPTAMPPPPELEGVDLDLDDFLDDNDAVTRVGSVEEDLSSMEKDLLDPFEEDAPPSSESTLDVSVDAFATPPTSDEDIISSPPPPGLDAAIPKAPRAPKVPGSLASPVADAKPAEAKPAAPKPAAAENPSV